MPSPGDLPEPGIKPTSPALADGFFTPEPPGKPEKSRKFCLMEDTGFQQIPLQSGRDLSFVDCGIFWSQWIAFLLGRLPADTELLIQQ